MYSLLIKHDYGHSDINHKEKMNKIILANLNGYKLSFKLSLPQQSQIGENASSQDRKSTRLNSSHLRRSRMPSSA